MMVFMRIRDRLRNCRLVLIQGKSEYATQKHNRQHPIVDLSDK
jgi:hypothetical protein